MVEKALAYLANIKGPGREVTEEDKNDVANIFSSSFEEYSQIWDAINKNEMEVKEKCLHISVKL